jgi:hypothetical protein
MVSVRINGEDAALRAEGLGSISEVVELIKSSIDPEHMITNISLNGNELSDSDWVAPTKQYETVIIEVETGTPGEFVRSRMGMASRIVGAMHEEFAEARKLFQTGNMVPGNKRLMNAVNTARAFFEWYGSMLALIPQDEKPRYDIGATVQAIAEICKRLCQQQLYQSWWALAETIEKDLEPKLTQLEQECGRFALQ